MDKNEKKLPPRTVERLSRYRRILSSSNEEYIYSHSLAKNLNLTPVQVRRDLMLIGVSGNHRKGYKVQELIKHISKTIDSESGINIAIVGMGNLGRALTTFIGKNKTQMSIIAGFDTDIEKIEKNIAGVPCYHINEIIEKIERCSIDIIVLSTPPEEAPAIARTIVDSGIKGILNFTSVHLDVPESVYLKNYDIITSLEEIGFFIKD